MTKAEYLKETTNLPLVVCDKHFYPVSEKSQLYRCEMHEDGFKCPFCKTTYKYESIIKCRTVM